MCLQTRLVLPEEQDVNDSAGVASQEKLNKTKPHNHVKGSETTDSYNFNPAQLLLDKLSFVHLDWSTL